MENDQKHNIISSYRQGQRSEYGRRGNEEENRRFRQMGRDLDILFGQVKTMKRELAALTHAYSKVEDEFLTRTNGKDVHILFQSGNKLKGKLLGSDKYCLYLQKNGNADEPVLVFKSAVCSLEYS